MVISQLISSYSGFFPDKKEMYIFLEEIFKKDISYFYAHQDQIVEEDKAKLLLEYAKRRIKSEPVAYILGKTNFFGNDFIVDQNVLIPRYDTEVLVEQAINEASNKISPCILDLACGSGCIGISIAKEVKDAVVVLSDISEKCIDITNRNIKLNNVISNCRTKISDLFNEIDGRFDIIVSNPPYIPFHEYISLDKQVADFEPEIALLAGDNGTEFYVNIAKRAKDHLSYGGSLMFEVGYNQAQSVEKILKRQGYTDISKYKDVQGIFRVVCAKYSM